MGVFVGDIAVIPISDLGHFVSVEVERIEENTVYLGKVKGGTVPVELLTLEEGDVLEEDAVVHAEAHWEYKKEIYPIKLIIEKILEGRVYFKSCDGQVPLQYLSSCDGVQIWGKVDSNGHFI